jgi:hypothetical protein
VRSDHRRRRRSVDGLIMAFLNDIHDAVRAEVIAKL